MTKLLTAIVLSLAALSAGAQTSAQPAKPAAAPAAAPAAPATPAAAPAAAPLAQLPPECAQRIQREAEKLKKQLELTDAQAAAVANENQRFRGVMLTARAEHRTALSKILTPEQLAKLEGKRGQMRQRALDRCAGDGDDDDADDDAPKAKGKDKPKAKP